MKIFTLFLFYVMFVLAAHAQSPAAPKVVHFKELQKFLPTKSPDGFTRGKPKGQTVSASGVSTSQASVEFTADKKEKQLVTLDSGAQDSLEIDVQWTISAEIIDYAGLGEGMTASLQMITAMEFDNETEDGYEKSTTFNGYKGTEKLRSQESSKSASLQIVVGNRFIVNVNGNNFADVAPLYALLKSMDLKKLESAK